MASPAINPAPQPAGGPPQGAPGGGAGVSQGTSWLEAFRSAPMPQKLQMLTMGAQIVSSEDPATAPMMREVQNQCRQATMKMIQNRQATQQATPQI